MNHNIASAHNPTENINQPIHSLIFMLQDNHLKEKVTELKMRRKKKSKVLKNIIQINS